MDFSSSFLDPVVLLATILAKLELSKKWRLRCALREREEMLRE